MNEIKGPLKGDPSFRGEGEETDESSVLLVLLFLVDKIVFRVFFRVFKFRVVLI